MAVIVNNPNGNEEPGSSSALIVGVILLFLIVILFVYGIPGLRRSVGTAPGEVPQTGESDQQNSLNVDIPDKVDVNVNK